MFYVNLDLLCYFIECTKTKASVYYIIIPLFFNYYYPTLSVNDKALNIP